MANCYLQMATRLRKGELLELDGKPLFTNGKPTLISELFGIKR